MTIEQISRDLGVSKSTVSRALSGKGRIGPETRKRIQEYAAQAGVKAAAQKQPERKRCLGLVLPVDVYTTNTQFFQECLLGVSEAASLLQYNVMAVAGARNDVSRIRAMVENKTVDGFILMRSVEDDLILKYLTEIHFPTALTGQCGCKEVIQVDSDNRKAAESLVSLIIGQGYRRFALVVGDMEFEVNEERRQGFYDAVDRFGLPREQQLVYPNFTDVELVDSIISDALITRAECIVCGDDVICTRMMSRLLAKRYRIPRDVSVVSLYNSTNLECFSPAVTSVNISAKWMGDMAAKQLINCLEGKSYQEKTMLDYEILFRQSAGKDGRI